MTTPDNPDSLRIVGAVPATSSGHSAEAQALYDDAAARIQAIKARGHK